jgi:hypothetical protein
VRGPTLRSLRDFVCRKLALQAYLRRPGDGRQKPQIRAADLLWSLLAGQILRQWSFHGVEALVRRATRRSWGVLRRFGDDALAYFTERLDPEPMRRALIAVLRRAKRNKAFETSRLIGLALDGTGAGRSAGDDCSLCHPLYNERHEVLGHLHHFSLISIVGAGLSLPFDVEPYGAFENELEASKRLLPRAVGGLGERFADYVVGDGLYATAPFCHVAGDLGLRVVARLKENHPELLREARLRFDATPPALTFEDRRDFVEVWDAEDFPPWETLRWKAVRIFRYRQRKPDGSLVEAYWLTDFPASEVGPRSLYRIAKSRWEIENQGFNDAKNRHGIEHIAHHHQNSLLIGWLIAVLALTVERLYRLRYLHRGTHPPSTAADLVLRLWLSLGAAAAGDTS